MKIKAGCVTQQAAHICLENVVNTRYVTVGDYVKTLGDSCKK